MPDEILLKIQADIKDLKTKIKKIESDFSGSSKKIQKDADAISSKFKGMGNVLKAALSVAALYKLKQGIQSTIQAAISQENAIRSLASIMNTMKTATKEETAELINYAEQLQKTTTFSDDNIQKAMAMAGTFQLTADQIREVIPRAMDMAAAIKLMTGREMDLAEVTNMIGKSINGTIGFLTRYGVVIDENAIASDKFSGIMKSLDDNFKGQSEALKKTTEGSLLMFKNEMTDVSEKIGTLFIPGLIETTKLLNQYFVPALNRSISAIERMSSKMGEWWEKTSVENNIAALKFDLYELDKQLERGLITQDEYNKKNMEITKQLIVYNKTLRDVIATETEAETQKDKILNQYTWEEERIKALKAALDAKNQAKREGLSLDEQRMLIINQQIKDWEPESIIEGVEGTKQGVQELEAIIKSANKSQDKLNNAWGQTGVQAVYDLGRAIDIVFSRAENKAEQLRQTFFSLLGFAVGMIAGGGNPTWGGIGASIGSGIGGLFSPSTSGVGDRSSIELSNQVINSKSYSAYKIGV